MRLRHASLCCCLLGLVVPAACMGAEAIAQARPLRLALDSRLVLDADLPRQDPERRSERANVLPRHDAPTPGSPAYLRQQAVQGLLLPPEQPEAMATSDASPFRFRRQGNRGSELGRDLRRGYQNMCDNVSRKVWDDPNGKRVKFDVAGKPGVAFEIPIH